MALANYTPALPAPSHPLTTTGAPLRLDPLDDLLYSPEEHQSGSAARPNEPFAPPRRKLRKRAGAPYLPPPNHYAHYPPYMHAHAHAQLYDNPRLGGRAQEPSAAYDAAGAGAGGYVHDPSGDYDGFAQRRQDAPSDPPAPAPDYAPRSYFDHSNPYRPTSSQRFDVKGGSSFQNLPHGGGQSFQTLPNAAPSAGGGQGFQSASAASLSGVTLQPAAPSGFAAPPAQPSGFTKVEGVGGGNTKTQLHAVLDYDDDAYDDVPGEGGVNVLHQQVTPLQGPIMVKNGSVPVVPLFPYPTVNNGSYYQIPIVWTALSLALGYELQGQVIRGVPCVKRNYQLYCPTAGNTYPLDKIETFIDENKALMKRMYGAFGSGGAVRTRRAPGVPDPHPAAGDSFFGRAGREGSAGGGGRPPRQASRTPPPLTPSQGNSSNRVDACESKTEIVTPYWALNSARKLRAVVNTMHFEQAIHQEVCSKTTTSRCSGDCGCEQKYKWHRLLAYDPEEDCAGIFMDWFLFPSCCVCRCNP